MSESEGVWRTIGGRRIFIAKGQSLSEAMNKSGKFRKMSDAQKKKLKDLAKKKKEGVNGSFTTEHGSEVRVTGLKPKMVGDDNWGKKYGEYNEGKYKDGLEVGDRFGLRMKGTRNTNVYGKIKSIKDDIIEVEHPKGTIYKVPTNHISTADKKELRFHTGKKDESWFGFINLNSKETEIDDK